MGAEELGYIGAQIFVFLVIFGFFYMAYRFWNKLVKKHKERMKLKDLKKEAK